MKSRSKFYNLRDAVGGLALTTALLWPYAASALEIDVFASIAGLQCAGSSTDPRFANTIFVRSLSGGVTAGSSGGTSGAPITAQPTPVPLRIAKDFDQCSPLLFKAAVLAQRFERVTISFIRPELGFVFFEIELTNAIVQDMTLGASDVLAQTSEELSFAFQTIRLTDIILGPDGNPGGRVVVECDFVLRRCS